MRKLAGWLTLCMKLGRIPPLTDSKGNEDFLKEWVLVCRDVSSSPYIPTDRRIAWCVLSKICTILGKSWSSLFQYLFPNPLSRRRILARGGIDGTHISRMCVSCFIPKSNTHTHTHTNTHTNGLKVGVCKHQISICDDDGDVCVCGGVCVCSGVCVCKSTENNSVCVCGSKEVGKEDETHTHTHIHTHNFL
eukprot:GHVR01067865.1.p1 GENE.GHVR01067865.1~~GHVR01067865.1.p1  ORF type:complete len:191 (-),score=102.28 GHVR01067865.1:141-713(-)